MKYLVEPEDCLTDIKDRPFSYDVILQVINFNQGGN